MDVSHILESSSSKELLTIERETPLEVDVGLLCVTDSNPIDEEEFKTNRDEYLQSNARDAVQTLVAALFSLPTLKSQDGPLAQLPPPTTHLPRAKPLPKPKPPTKWERFAAAKGIQKKRREKKVWDEERQEWVNRWGRDGKNRQKEDQWITEVPANADADHDPVKVARDARKARVAKNERQKLQNDARAQGRDERKTEIDRTLATTRASTASMGRFDRKLEGEKKLRGVKRKYEPNEVSHETEKQASLALLSKLDSDSRKTKKPATGGDDVLNVRKAIRHASKGQGGVALGRSYSSAKAGGKGKGKGRGGKR